MFATPGIKKHRCDKPGKRAVERGECAIKNGDEREEEDPGNCGVFLRDEKEQKHDEHRESLPKREFQHADQIELQKIGVVNFRNEQVKPERRHDDAHVNRELGVSDRGACESK